MQHDEGFASSDGQRVRIGNRVLQARRQQQCGTSWAMIGLQDSDVQHGLRCC